MKTIDATEGELWRAMLYVKKYDQFIDDLKTNTTKDKYEEDELDRLWSKLIKVSSITGIKP